MSDANREELRAFEKKMHDEGADGFADGPSPWETWDESGNQAGSRVWEGRSRRIYPKKRSQQNIGDRVLSGLAMLSIATMIVGIAGIYFSDEPARQLAKTRIQPAPIERPDNPVASPAPHLAAAGTPAPDSGTLETLPAPAAGANTGIIGRETPAAVAPLTAMPLSAASEPDSTSSVPAASSPPPVAATAKVTQTSLKPIAAVTEMDTTDSVPSASAPPPVAATPEARPVPLMPTTVVTELDTTGSVPVPGTPPTVAAKPVAASTPLTPTTVVTELDTTGSVPVPGTPPTVAAKPVAASTPLTPTTVVTKLDTTGSVTMPGTPPTVAAKPVAASAPLTPPAIVTELNIIFNSGPLASAPPTVAATPKTYTAPRPTTAAASDTDSTSSTPVTAATAVTSPETLPAPAAGPAAIKATNTGLVERKPTITQAVATGDNGTTAQTDHPSATKEPTLIKAPDPSDNAAAVIAVAEPPPPAPPETPAIAVEKQAATGDWVVNLASYTWKSTAGRKLGEFRNKGVEAELVTVTIKGKPMHRVRVGGFENRRAAQSQVSALEKTLGLEGAWVARR
jgi:cell division septation protein DedD